MPEFVLEPKQPQYYSTSAAATGYKDIFVFFSVLLFTISLLFVLISVCAYNLHPDLFQQV